MVALMAYVNARPAWFPTWTDETAILVASGPSAASVPLDDAQGLARFCAVNASWALCPWADVLYAGDAEWWTQNRAAHDFAGLKVSQDPKCLRLHPRLQHVTARMGIDRIITEDPALIGWGGNSGFQALNLVVHFRPARIVLVGFDMTLANGSHWHGEHDGPLRNPADTTVQRWRAAMDNAAGTIAALGIEVVNCSPGSALQNFRKVDFSEVMEWLSTSEASFTAPSMTPSELALFSSPTADRATPSTSSTRRAGSRSSKKAEPC